MKIILTKDVENLGFKYDELEVKPGYARNYLIPKGYAILSFPGMVKDISEIMKHRSKKEESIIEKSKEIEKKLKGLTLQVKAKVGQGGKLFGSVSNKDLMEVLNKKGISIERKLIRIPGNKIIKTIGKQHAIIRLHKEIEIDFNFEVVTY
ncbi:50S ribosomal protein L9 [Blattabacterium cuenoti]